MFARIAYKQNINMWKTNFSLDLQHLKLILATKLFFRQKRFSQILLIYFFTYFGISELEVPGTWKLGAWSSRNLGTCLRVSGISRPYIKNYFNSNITWKVCFHLRYYKLNFKLKSQMTKIWKYVHSREFTRVTSVSLSTSDCDTHW